MSRSSRKSMFAALTLLAFGSAAWASDKHELLGTWSVDVSKLAQPSPPRSVTLTLAEAGGGAFRMTVDIVDADGNTSHAEGTSLPDGSATKVVGSLDVDVVSITMPSNRILVMGAGMAGHPSSSRVFSLADDGKHMIETVIRHREDGTPYTLVNTWTRQRG